MSEKYALIAAEKVLFPVKMMCRLLGVSKSGFYDWLDRPLSETARRREELAARVRFEFEQSGRTYGYRRIHAKLVRRGVQADDELVRRLMCDLGLIPVQVRRRRGLTVPDQQAGPIPDLVRRDFTAVAPGAKMVGDITQINTGEGPLFLATVIDCFSKSVIGWAMDIRYPASLVCAAVDMAALRIELPDGSIFHSDHGSQYTSQDFAGALKKHGIKQSLGRTGICYDNSLAESFFGKLKSEWVHHRRFATRAEARREVILYIEGFYNRSRLHSGLGYRTPFEVLEEWQSIQAAA